MTFFSKLLLLESMDQTEAVFRVRHPVSRYISQVDYLGHVFVEDFEFVIEFEELGLHGHIGVVDTFLTCRLGGAWFLDLFGSNIDASGETS